MCAHGNADIAALLIDNGAVVNFQNKVNNVTLIAEILTVYLYSVALHPYVLRVGIIILT